MELDDKIFRFQEFCKLETVKDENFSMQLKMYSLYLEGVEHKHRMPGIIPATPFDPVPKEATRITFNSETK